jgi:hypothetical protein
MARGEMRLIAALCLLATACGTFHLPTARLSPSPQTAAVSTSPTPVASPSPDPSPSPVPTPDPPAAAPVASASRLGDPCSATQLRRSFPASPASNRNLVIAKVRGSDQTVIRDVTDINRASTIAAVNVAGWGGDGWGSPSFASASTISYIGDAHGLMRSALTGSEAQILVTACNFATIVTWSWSPDGQSFTYVLEPADWSAHIFEWHLVSAGVDRVIGKAPAWCHCGNGSEDSSVDVRFSPDGHFVSLVDSFWNGTNLQVRRLDGSLVGTEIAGDPSQQNPVTMGVWSGTDLFFRDLRGVERWRGGAITLFLPGVSWLHPRASPTGSEIVYSARGSDGLARVYAVDSTNGQSRQLSSQPRTVPMFLTSRYIWYRGERLCGSNEPGMCLKTTFTDKTYVFDMQTGTEFESIITDIADVWPHGA